MWVLLARRRRRWLMVALPIAGWLIARKLGTGGVPARLPGRRPSDRQVTEPTPHPVEVTGHGPASSPHARDIAAHNTRVIDDYRGRHAAPGVPGAP